MTGYTISYVAKKLGLTAHTLRYYDKEGLLPFVEKSSSGIRVFSDKDVEWLILIECLKGTGMTIKDIKQYIDWFMEGDSTLQKRLDMFKQQKENLEKQALQIKKHMEKIDYKIAYYTEAIKNGGIDSVKQSECLAKEKERVFGKINL